MTYLERLPPIKFLSHGLVRSCGKPKTYLCYCSAYEHQALQGGDLPWQAPSIIVTSPFNHMVLLQHVTNKKYIFRATISMTTTPGKMVTYNEELPLLELLDPSATWFCEVNWHIKYSISPLAPEQLPLNMAKWCLTVRSFHL